IGIKNFIIRVNSRGLLEQISDKLKLGKERVKVFQIIDKGDKIGKQEVARELEMLLGKGKAKELLTLLESDLITVKKSGYSMGDIDNLLKYAKFYGISDKVEVDLSLVRGLAYYTGLIFEVSVGEKQSIAGGGRYDDLIEKFGGRKIPATGISLGLDRILEILKEKNYQKTLTKVLVIPISEEQEEYAIKVLQEIRGKGVNSGISFGKLGKGLEYANKLGIPYVIFIGKEEFVKKKVKLRDMKSGKERVIFVSEISKIVK
ncbi:MAG: ATP phosphoribosyltransferase regulatory subunit, partial [Nanoarchaeota archaeon]